MFNNELVCSSPSLFLILVLWDKSNGTSQQPDSQTCMLGYLYQRSIQRERERDK